MEKNNSSVWEFICSDEVYWYYFLTQPEWERRNGKSFFSLHDIHSVVKELWAELISRDELSNIAKYLDFDSHQGYIEHDTYYSTDYIIVISNLRERYNIIYKNLSTYSNSLMGSSHKFEAIVKIALSEWERERINILISERPMREKEERIKMMSTLSIPE